jgi:hypothetical protein
MSPSGLLHNLAQFSTIGSNLASISDIECESLHYHICVFFHNLQFQNTLTIMNIS